MNQRNSGSSLVELSSGLLIMIPIALYGVDMASIYMASSVNSSLCREACRAAASGPPTVFCPDASVSPAKRVERVLSVAKAPGSIIQVSSTPVITENILDPRPIYPWGGPVQGEVTVQTEVTVNPPFKLPAIDSLVRLKTQSSFPITWMMPAKYNVVVQGTSSKTPIGKDPPSASSAPSKRQAMSSAF